MIMVESNNMTSNTLPQEEEGISFAELWSLFWDHKRWYVASMVLCLLVAVLFLYRTPKEYSRTMKVVVDESTQDAALRNLGVASAGMYRMRSGNSIENELEAFKSPDLMLEVVERLGLQTRYFEKQWLRSVELYRNSPVELVLAGTNMPSGFSLEIRNLGDNQIALRDFRYKDIKDKTIVKGMLGDTLQTPVGNLVIHPTAKIEDFEHPIRISWVPAMKAAKSYTNQLSVAMSGKESSVLVLSMNDVYPLRTEQVLRTLLDVYNETWVRNKNRASIATTEFINERLLVIENQLNLVEKSLKEYKETNNLTDLQAVGQAQIQESSAYAAKAFEVSNQLSVAKYIKEYLHDPANELALIPSNVGLERGSSVDSQIKDYNELLIQRDRLVAGSSTNNPLVADITSALQSMRTAIMRSTDNLIATLEMQQEKIQGQEQALVSKMTSNTGQAFELLSIERDQKIKQELYVFLLQKREENELAALVNVGNTRLIMNPNGSNFPVAPRSMMILLVALILGVGLPFAVFFLGKILDRKIRCREDLGRQSIPFLAEIPHYGQKLNGFQRRFAKAAKKNSNQYGIIVEPGKRDLMNEAFRVLRTNTDMMLGSEGQGAKVVMFTSFLPNSGKSVTIKNLAASMALKDAKVLLIDLDLRKASLSKSLGLHHSGVAAYLNGKSESYLELADEVVPNLHVLPVGSLPPNPSELLLSPRFSKMMASAREDFDYVFLDCPPIGLVVDARIITEFVDMTAFVLRADQVEKDVLPLMHDLYEKGTYKHMAIILNDVQLEYKKYGYGKGSYGYGYGN